MSQAQHPFVGGASHNGCIELPEDFPKVNRWVLNDPVIFAIGTGYKSIETGGNAVNELAHAPLLISGYSLALRMNASESSSGPVNPRSGIVPIPWCWFPFPGGSLVSACARGSL